MKALFIGGTGNISLSISKKLLALGWELTVLNRGSRNELLPGAKYIKADMSDEAAVAGILEGLSFDVVAQFIAFKPEQAARDVRLFKGKCRQYIFISSASAYHKPILSPFITESTPLHNPYWQYSRDKAACEAVLMESYGREGFPVTIVRPSHTYGDSALPLAVHGKNGAWQVLERILREKPVIISGDGTNLWTVTWSDDFADGFIGLMGNPHALGEAVHITSDEALSWNMIHQTIADIMGKPFLPCYVPAALLGRIEGLDYRGALVGDKANTVMFDNSKLKRLVTGFCAKTRFDQGAALSVANFLGRKELQKPDPDFDRICDRAVEIMVRAEQEFSQLGV